MPADRKTTKVVADPNFFSTGPFFLDFEDFETPAVTTFVVRLGDWGLNLSLSRADLSLSKANVSLSEANVSDSDANFADFRGSRQVFEG